MPGTGDRSDETSAFVCGDQPYRHCRQQAYGRPLQRRANCRAFRRVNRGGHRGGRLETCRGRRGETAREDRRKMARDIRTDRSHVAIHLLTRVRDANGLECSSLGRIISRQEMKQQNCDAVEIALNRRLRAGEELGRQIQRRTRDGSPGFPIAGELAPGAEVGKKDPAFAIAHDVLSL
jgi:hypothetical protein